MKLRANLGAIVFSILTSAAASAELPTQDVDAGVLVTRARGAVDAYLELWSAYPASGLMQAFEEDAVLEYAHSIPEVHAQVTGRQSMITQVQAVAQLGEDWKFTQPTLYPTPYPNIYYVEYRASARLKATGEASSARSLSVWKWDPRKPHVWSSSRIPRLLRARRQYAR